LGAVLDKSISELLKEYLDKNIPDDEFVFRSVSLKLFIQGKPNHKLEMISGIFANEKGDGLSVDWEMFAVQENYEVSFLNGNLLILVFPKKRVSFNMSSKSCLILVKSLNCFSKSLKNLLCCLYLMCKSS